MLVFSQILFKTELTSNGAGVSMNAVIRKSEPYSYIRIILNCSHFFPLSQQSTPPGPTAKELTAWDPPGVHFPGRHGTISLYETIPLIIAIRENTAGSSAVRESYGCVVVLDGRQPACVLRLALQSPSSLPFPALFPRIAIDSDKEVNRMSNREQVIQKIQQEKIIAIVRGVGPDQCAKVANALYAGGIRLMEITYNQKDPASFQTTADAIQTIGKAYEGRMYVGAGTVTTPELVEHTAKAQGRFIISPDVNEAVIARTRELDMVSLPGALTPTEVMTAYRAGADFVKVFPVGSLGVAYVKALRAPISHVKLMAVGGVNENNVADFLKAGMVGAGIGGNLVNQAWIDAGAFDKITETARALTEAVKNI